MLAAVYHDFQKPLKLIEVPDAILPENGVVLEVKASGLCRSDWHGWMGHDSDITLPHVPGHELAGVIVEKGKHVRNWQIGQRVTLPFVCGCGSCSYCQQGQQQVCDSQSQPGFTHWGSFAQYVAIDFAEHNLVALPESISDVTAAALGCRFATAFRALKDQGQLQSGQWLAVFGCGGVGLSAIMIGKALHARVVAIDLHEEPLQLAKQLGAEVQINASTENSAEVIQEITKGGVHLSVDAFGSPALVAAGLLSLRKRGKHVQVGLLPPQLKNVAIPMDIIVANELELVGSHGMQAYRYPEMLEMIVKGLMDPSKLISQTITLGESLDALANMDSFDHSGIRVISNFTK